MPAPDGSEIYLAAFDSFGLTFDSVEYNCGTITITPNDTMVPRTGTLDQGNANHSFAETSWSATGTLLMENEDPRSLPPRKVKKTAICKDGFHTITGKASIAVTRQGGGTGGAEYNFTLTFAGPVVVTELFPAGP